MKRLTLSTALEDLWVAGYGVWTGNKTKIFTIFTKNMTETTGDNLLYRRTDRS